MSPRAGLDRAAVVEVAAALADEEGFEELSLARLAERLGVRKPSLYNHVAGLEGIRRELVLLGLQELRRALSEAGEEEEGEAAIFSLAAAYRVSVKEHPGLYGATVRSYRLYAPGDSDLAEAEGEALEPVLSALASCEAVDESFDRILRAFVAGMPGGKTGRGR